MLVLGLVAIDNDFIYQILQYNAFVFYFGAMGIN